MRPGRRAVRVVAAVTAFIVTALVAAACAGSKSPEAETAGTDAKSAAAAADAPSVSGTGAATPAEYAEGEGLFNANCARCHGPRGTGTEQGPPLVHIIYEPNHHSDAAFQMAAQNGVRAHHWSFGDMPPVPGITPEQVAEVVGYVRWLQREAGIE
jgi:mono/diheme cytochrome c family protein